MQKFLEHCAQYIYSRYARDLKDITIVFPNRRAGVFFNAYLGRIPGKPVIGPGITTINDLMLSLSPLVVADKLMLIVILHDIFTRETGSQESLDEFYFWGEVLLGDFDDIDKYLVNSKDLFQNIAGIKELEHHFDYLTEEQKKTLEQFWGSIKNWQTRSQQKDFVNLWDKLGAIYDNFRNELMKRQTGYAGMVMRDGISRLGTELSGLPSLKYLFVGLNALNNCEKQLFLRLQAAGKAEFLWDFDEFYLNNTVNDAGKFLRQNILMFPPPEDFKPDCRSFSSEKSIQLISVPSAAGQTQVIPGLLSPGSGCLPGKHEFDKTAVVLADESLLFNALGALPEDAGKVNVTMGYPVKYSPVNGFLYLLSALLRNAPAAGDNEQRLYFRQVTDILNHQILAAVEPVKVKEFLRNVVAGNRIYLEPGELFFSRIHELVFTLPSGVAEYPGYFLRILEELYVLASESESSQIVREIISQLYQSAEQVASAIQEAGKEISPGVFFRLFYQYLGKISVPFEGEPLSGMQVMGILETRCLDFENLIIIGLNEEIWPRAFTAPSMIPYSLRKGFGLPGIDDQDAMYAYYFYRLIQRSGKVTATWNSIREGVSGGEMSRYGFQLMMASPHKVITGNHDYPFLNKPPVQISIPSGPAVSAKLAETYSGGRALSPSAINTWLTCSLKFYFKYVMNIDEPDEVSEEIDRRLFGNIFHSAIENLYLPWVGGVIDEKVINRLLADKVNIEKCIRQAFATEYFKLPAERASDIRIEGKSRLVFSTIRSYLVNLLELDKKFAPIQLHSLEGGYYAGFRIKIGDRVVTIRVGGKIDRLDATPDSIRVIDYKTGNLQNSDLACRTLDDLVDPLVRNQKKEIVQALIYSLVIKKGYFPDQNISAAIYAILRMNDEELDPRIKIGGEKMEIGKIEQEWEMVFTTLLERIFNPDAVFTQTEYKDRCSYCPYNSICMR
jgi:CRISPR/Cas system-associated exonuclease Cas4 (RecB family)